jgi:hypothetical protein
MKNHWRLQNNCVMKNHWRLQNNCLMKNRNKTVLSYLDCYSIFRRIFFHIQFEPYLFVLLFILISILKYSNLNLRSKCIYILSAIHLQTIYI